MAGMARLLLRCDCLGAALDLDRCLLRRSSEEMSRDLERVEEAALASLDLDRLLAGASDLERCRDACSAEEADDSVTAE